MNHKDLLTIGKLAELSGIHVKALRYYDRIGVLTPTIVDEDNGYRYYSKEHVLLVEIIKMCADVSIPLKELKNYLSDDGSIENVAELADIGIEKITQRIKEFQEQLLFLEEIKSDIQRITRIGEGKEDTIIRFEATDYWLEPYEGNIGDLEYHRLMGRLFEKLETDLGLKSKYEMGTAFINRTGKYESYMFIRLEKDEKNLDFDNVIRIPRTAYRSELTTEKKVASAQKIFPDLLSIDYEKFIFQLEIISVQMNEKSPKYEIRCSLPNYLRK
ncbi:hypothetical protein NRIC_25450 [Enterococcus florum]|uniref:HTH merR-type domain-containing protein n=1 Tax=Enterococcus florum TaxID=2480627 RepID=A0A4P5PDM9_9ENTE|nr:MerR family transcriptional regulator [Enterococcus florum]GCF94654.1 hypothetical protein NRIC_25450 [Enterococcus florum]